jgi:predicted ABC-type ATPase
VPNVYIIAGPNGAGKTTFAREFLPNYANCRIFINADLIAQGLSPFDPDRAAFRAGRVALQEIKIHAERLEDFGFETTLSGKAHVSIISGLKDRGYKVHLFYLWVPNPELTLSRIKDRVLRGGHNVPEDVVRRRFPRSFRNFWTTYRRLAHRWLLFNSSSFAPQSVASFSGGKLHVVDPQLYNKIVAVFPEHD